jgi:hypothetical protein
VKRPALYLPPGQLPTWTAAGVRTPAGLILPVVVRSGGDETVRCAASFDGLGLPKLRLAEVIDLVRDLPFEPSMRFLGAMLAAVHHADGDAGKELLVAREVFGEGDVLNALRGWVSKAPGHQVFDHRGLTTLQRLLVDYSWDGSDDDLPSAKRAVLLTCVLAMGDVLPDKTPPEPAENGAYDVGAWTAFTVQSGAYYDMPYVLEAFARAFGLFVDVAPQLDSHPDFCPLDEWAIESPSSLGLAEQIAAGFAFAIGSRALDPTASLQERFGHIAPGYLDQAAIAGQEPELVESISADRAWFREEFRGSVPTDSTLGWEHTPFERRPFLRRSDGTILLISPRALISWVTRGIYFRMLDAARARSHPTRDDATLASRYLRFVGAVTERYVRGVVSDGLTITVRAGGACISGDEEYKVGKRRLRAPDIAIAQPPDLVFMEIYSGRIPRDARVSGTPEAIGAALQRMVIDKFSELGSRVGDFLCGHFRVDGMPDGEARRIWPVLVLAGESVFETPVLWQWIHERLPKDAFSDPCIQAPVICDLDDLDALLGLVEQGHTIPELLSLRQQSGIAAQFSVRNWVISQYALTFEDRPAYVDRGFEVAIRRVYSELFPDSQRFEQLWSRAVRKPDTVR